MFSFAEWKSVKKKSEWTFYFRFSFQFLDVSNNYLGQLQNISASSRVKPRWEIDQSENNFCEIVLCDWAIFLFLQFNANHMVGV